VDLSTRQSRSSLDLSHRMELATSPHFRLAGSPTKKKALDQPPK
jgi:hypothetical protein